MAYREFDESTIATMESNRGGTPAATNALVALVASALAVDADALSARNRGPASVAFARQVVMYLAYTRLHFSYALAGGIFHRDRTTAAHACRVVEEMRDDPRIDSTLDYLERALDLCPKFRTV